MASIPYVSGAYLLPGQADLNSVAFWRMASDVTEEGAAFGETPAHAEPMPSMQVSPTTA